MYEQVKTGPLYDKVVQLMATYRSVAARMQNAKASTQGKLDRRLERLAEQIGERLEELTDMERLALECWQAGKTPGTFEIDHAEITERPYVSIRKISRWTEVIDRAEEREAKREAERSTDNTSSGKLKDFLKTLEDDNDGF
jgi:hypothetical protein